MGRTIALRQDPPHPPSPSLARVYRTLFAASLLSAAASAWHPVGVGGRLRSITAARDASSSVLRQPARPPLAPQSATVASPDPPPPSNTSHTEPSRHLSRMKTSATPAQPAARRPAAPSAAPPGGEGSKSFGFVVHGKVQGVFFRKHTQKKATELGLVGWVRNADDGSVEGEVQGDAAKLQLMEKWLRTTGSPKSRIDRLEVRERRSVGSLGYSGFNVRG